MTAVLDRATAFGRFVVHDRAFVDDVLRGATARCGEPELVRDAVLDVAVVADTLADDGRDVHDRGPHDLRVTAARGGRTQHVVDERAVLHHEAAERRRPVEHCGHAPLQRSHARYPEYRWWAYFRASASS